MRLAYRQWSILADMGEQGRELLATYRDLRRATQLLGQAQTDACLADVLRTGTGMMILNGNRPRRIDPSRFYAPLTDRPAAS